ncbi:hypothetical protein D3C85_936090 [compost metagenome]
MRLHAIIAGQLHADEGHAVEQFTAAGGLAQGQLALQRGEVALHVGIERLVVPAGLFLPGQRAVVAQAPVSQVDAAIEPGVERVGVAVAGLGAGGVEVVAQYPGGDAVVPELRAHVAPGIAPQAGLGNAEVQAQGAHVEGGAGVVDQGGEVGAGVGLVQAQEGRLAEPVEVHADLVENFAIDADQGLALVVAGDAHVTAQR